MPFLSVSSYFFPTTIVFVDDNRNFLDIVSAGLDADVPCQTFESPQKALDDLIQHSQNDCKWHDSILTTSGNISSAASQGAELDLTLLREQAYQNKRFAKRVVVIVDYAMPTINGLEFCEKLTAAGVPCKKLMLTGEADHSTAVEAFNKQIIHKFVLKSQITNNFELLFSIIAELQQQFFIEESQRIMQHLQLDPLAPFQDQAFIELFESICKEHKIVEYYLFDTSGSFMLLTADGKSKWFIVKNQEDHEMCCNMAEDAEVSSKTYAALKNGKVLPFYPDGGFNIPDRDWSSDYLIPANVLEYADGKVLYYGVTDQPGNSKSLIDSDRIQSLNDYLSNR